MSETWIDKNSGKTFVGREAAAPYLGMRSDYNDGIEPDLAPLGEVIDAERLDFPTDLFEKDEPPGLTRDELIAYGQWIVHLLEQNPVPRPMRKRHAEMLRALGIGATLPTIRAEFVTFIDFEAEVGLSVLHARGRFSTWSLTNYIEFASKLATRVGRRPRESDYLAASEAGECPNPVSIVDYVGSLGALNEYIGYPDIRHWQDDQFVAWGAKALRANIETGLTRDVIGALSKLERGPATRTVIDHFKALSEYQYLAEKALMEEDVQIAERRAKRLDQYSWLVADDLLDIEYLDDDDAMLVAGSQRIIVDRFLTGAEEERKRAIAQGPANTFMVSLLQEHSRSGTGILLPGQIEAWAHDMGVFEYVWPVNQDLSHLKVALPRTYRPAYRLGDYQRKYAAKQAA